MSEDQDKPFEAFTGGSSYEGGLTVGQYYNGTVSAMVVRRIEGPNIQFPGDKVIWTFSLEGTTETIDGMTSMATGENSKAADWLIALFGKARYDQRDANPIKKEEIVGRPCMVLVAFNDKGWPRVQAVLPRQNAPQAPVQPQPAPSAPVPSAAPPAPSSAPSQQNENYDDLPF